MATIYVGNLPQDAKEDSVRRLFSTYGRVQSVRLMRGGSDLRGRSYGFVEMLESGTASRAAQNLNGQYFRGKLLHVERYDSARPSVR